MIKIVRKEDSTGCNACVQICPKQCISMHTDELGFNYPRVDVSLCVDCGLCEKVCPVINQDEPQNPVGCWAAKNEDAEVRDNSSSGGVFGALAADVLKNRGVVFGAVFADDWSVEHAAVEREEQLGKVQRSKYVQSRIGETYKEAAAALKQGRQVLFCGTSCQIAGLRKFLRRDYDDLLTLEVVCHGVPAPGVWQAYLQRIADDANPVEAVNFRDKRISWKSFGLSIKRRNGDISFATHTRNPYMLGFLKDIYLRPSCFECPAKGGRSGADITLADFWGIDKAFPQYYEQGCYSLVLAYSDKGREALKNLPGIVAHEVPYRDALQCNRRIEECVSRPREAAEFPALFAAHGFEAVEMMLRKMRGSIFKRIKRRLRRILRKRR